MLRRPRAFTLIELLVVVGIIGMLISVLLPILGVARRQAKATVCGVTLRELGRGSQLYADQYDGILVPVRPPSSPTGDLYWVGNGFRFRPRWYAFLGAAVEIFAYDFPSPDNVHQTIDNKMLICTEVPDWISERNISYGYNYQFLGNTRFRPGSSEFINYPVMLSRISGNTVIAADSLGTAANFPREERTPNLADGSVEPTSLGYHGFTLDPPRLAATTGTMTDSAPGMRGGPADRHLSKSNYVFADGHVDRVRPAAMGYSVRPDGSFERDGPNTWNTQFSGTQRDDDPPSAVP